MLSQEQLDILNRVSECAIKQLNEREDQLDVSMYIAIFGPIEEAKVISFFTDCGWDTARINAVLEHLLKVDRIKKEKGVLERVDM